MLKHPCPIRFIGACSFVIMAVAFCFSPALSSAALPKADKVLVMKGKRVLNLLRKGKVLKSYRIALGEKPVGKKICTGDKRTPEGKYVLDCRKADSKYYLALHISYPNEGDTKKAEQLGMLPGGDIMIHGLPEGYDDVDQLHRITDWTDGCIAVTNKEMEEIWMLVPDGTPIEIRP
jgi:murein L,D-transpeptidase YafK